MSPLASPVTPAATRARAPAAPPRARPLDVADGGARAVGSALLVVAALWTWALSGRVGFDSHEHAWPYLRVLAYAAEFRAGHLPQLFPDAFDGAGHAFPALYPPLAYWLTAALFALTGHIVAAVHLSFGLSVLLSGVAMHAMLRALRVARALALLGAVAFVSYPYRWYDVVERGALSESWVFVWLPCSVLASLRVARGARGGVAALALTTAALILTHTSLALFWLATLPVIALALGLHRDRPAAARAALALALGLLLSAWQLLPQWHDVPSLWVGDAETMWTRPEDLAQRAIPITALVFRREPGAVVGMGMGLAGLALLPLAFVAERRAPLHRLTAGGDAWAGTQRRVALLCVGVWLVTVLLQVYPPAFFSWSPAPFRFVQFAWRLQVIGGWAACTGAAVLLHQLLHQLHHRRAPRRVLALAALAVVGAALGTATRPRYVAAWTDATLRDPQRARSIRYADWCGLTIQGEYVPRAAPRCDVAGPIRPALRVAGARGVRYVPEGRHAPATLEAQGPGRVVLPLFAFPFLRLEDAHGRPLARETDGGYLAVTLGPGPHRLHVVRVWPASRVAGFAVSGLALAGLLLSFIPWKRPRRGPVTRL